jgi:energy-coupling factor transporter ATP-binding protein EcfA2
MFVVRSRFEQSLTLEEYRAYPPDATFPSALVDELAGDVVARRRLLFVGASGSGKSTLQLAVLAAASERHTRVTYVDKLSWTRPRPSANVTIVSDLAGVARDTEVLGFYELRSCGHVADPTCDRSLMIELVAAAQGGMGVSTTMPTGEDASKGIGFAMRCFPELVEVIDVVVAIDNRALDFAYTISART